MLPRFLSQRLAPAFTAWNRYVRPVVQLGELTSLPMRYRRYFRDMKAYEAMVGGDLPMGEPIPCLFDQSDTTPFAAEYFYQDVWAFKRIMDASPRSHVDVGSRVLLVGLLTAVTDVTFVDIRPIETNLPGLTMQAGSILELPYPDDQLESVSCLHVAEHIGLGRYGDPLDPAGTMKACRELARVLKQGGRLYFSLPIGRPRVCFNAHRIHAARMILQYFNGLELVEFVFVDPVRGTLNLSLEETESRDYGVGIFVLTKPESGGLKP